MTSCLDWQELTKFALELANAAGREILPFFRRELQVDVKSGAVWDPVTEADRAGERAMRSLIETRYPEHGILGEEYGIKDGRSNCTWVLDPIDGTRAFICGMPTWTTLIGLSVDGEPTIGVMNQPYVLETFYGNPEGAFLLRNDQRRPLRVRPQRPLSQAILTTTAPELYRTDAEKRILSRLSKTARLTRYGGDAYFFCLLAAGHIDIAMDARMETYDIAPLIPIIQGAGGAVSSWSRGPAAPGGNILSATGPALMEEAFALMNDAQVHPDP